MLVAAACATQSPSLEQAAAPTPPKTEERCGYTLSLDVRANPAGRFQGQLQLTNRSGEPATAFVLRLSFAEEADLISTQGGVFQREADGGYLVSAPRQLSRAPLRQGRTHRLGFAGRGSAEGVRAELLSINGRTCTPRERFVGNIWPNDTQDDPTFATYWNQVTPENAGKWGSVEAERGVMKWTDLDRAYAYAKEQAFPFRLHTLVWGSQQPAWLAGLSQAEQLEALESWMRQLAERYPDIDFIDVVNEPLHETPSYKEALGGDGATGWDWVIRAFELARAYFPEAELHLNDYNILFRRESTEQYLEIVALLQERGLIDGIGEQGHFLERTDLQTLRENLDLLAATGLPIYITELDVNFANDAQQANRLAELFPVFWEHEAVAGVTFWGYKENQIWRTDAYLLRADGSERPALVWLRCYLAGNRDCPVPEYVPQPRVGDEVRLRIEAEDYDDAQGIVSAGDIIAYIDAGDWVLYRNAQLRSDYNVLRIRYAKGSEAAGTLALRLGSLEAAATISVEIPSTGSWGTFTTLEVPLPPLEGAYDLFFTFHDVDAFGNFDYFEFGRSGRVGTEARLELEAESFDEQSGTEVYGSFVGNADDGDWLLFRGVEVRSSYTRFEATYARDAVGGLVEVRVGALDGPLAASFEPESTGGWNTFATLSTEFSAEAGPQDLYVLFTGSEGLGNFDRFALVSGE
ncbi:endo-1,4-beta-xylanase [Truepera radiovictrix]|nr:endo-1,4-beta-xylanase [Truepera radiovictrix]